MTDDWIGKLVLSDVRDGRFYLGMVVGGRKDDYDIQWFGKQWIKPASGYKTFEVKEYKRLYDIYREAILK